MQTGLERFIPLILSSQIRKKTYFLRVPPTKLAQTIISIVSPKIQLGPNWQQSTTMMAVARLRFNADSSEVFHIIDTII